MAKPNFVKFEVPKELVNKIYDVVALAKASGKIRRGLNETTKTIEKGLAKLVIIAEDVSPEEIVMHLPVLCDEKQVPYVYVPSKMDLGKSSGIEVPTSSITIAEVGEAKKTVEEIVNKIKQLKK